MNLKAYVFALAVLVPAFMAYFWARDLIENFFPDLTLIDLGAFYAMGLVSGLAAGVSLGLPKKTKANK